MEEPKRRGRSTSSGRAGMQIKRAISSKLREVWKYYDPHRREILNKAKRKEFKRKKDGTLGKAYNTLYLCNKCGLLFEKVQVDHIKPVGKMPGYPYKNTDIAKWIMGLFCDEANLQALCVECHKEKTKQDIRKMHGKEEEV